MNDCRKIRCLKCDSLLNAGKCPACDFDINDYPGDKGFLRDCLEKIKQQIPSAPSLAVGFLFAAKWAFTMLDDLPEAENLILHAEKSCESIIDYCNVAQSYILYFDNHENATNILNQARELASSPEEMQYICDVADAAGVVGL